MNKKMIVTWVKLMVLLMALWFVMSGIFETKFIMYGTFTCLLIATSSFRMMEINACRSDKTYLIMSADLGKSLLYMLWLIKELIKAALYVSAIVTFRRDRLNPQIIWFKADYDNPCARVVLANSITLTPGTVTVDILDNGVYAVHALTDELAEGLMDGRMQNKVAKVYDEVIEFTPLKAIGKKQGNNVPTPVLKQKVFKGTRKAL